MISTEQFDGFMQLMAQKTGLRIPSDMQNRFIVLLHERAERLGYSSPEAYEQFLSGSEASGEWEEFARLLASSETYFFRDHGQFDLLRLRLLPEIITRHRDTKTLRLWSAGCASGEEAYSLAMVVDMLLPRHNGWDVRIFGTDIDSRAIAKARLGRYGKWSFRMAPAAWQQRYFSQEGNEWVLDERIRRMVTFRIANLIAGNFQDPAAGLHDMDLILCRNLFIYFVPAAVSAVAEKLAATLAEGGYLMTAHTELIGYEGDGLESRLFPEGVVYQRRTAQTARTVSPAITSAAGSAPRQPLRPPPRKRLPVPVPAAAAAALPQSGNNAAGIAAAAHRHADRGEYELAEQMCRQSLELNPLVAAPYFLLAQLAQFRGDLELAKEQLNKAIYLEPHCVAAHLELAALQERAGNAQQAHALRHAALGIVRSMPADEQVEQYERTAGELAQWLAQWEQPANGGNGNHGGYLHGN